jgi:hypothetical protein
MERWARNQAMFNLYMAQSLPQVEIVGQPQVRALAGVQPDSATHEVLVTVRNSGFLPTALEQAKRVKIVRPDRVVVEMPRGSASRSVGRTEEFWLGGGESRTTVLRLRSGNAPADRRATVRALSTRGGVSEVEIRW